MFEKNDFEVDSQSAAERIAAEDNFVNAQATSQTSMQKYYWKTFMTMGLGLLVSAIVALLLSMNATGYRILIQVPWLTYVLPIMELGVVIAFSARLFKSSINTVRVMFFTYALLTGITFGFLQYIFEISTIFLAFGITCVYFGCLCLIGHSTKVNLSRFAPILFTGLICLIIFNVVAIFIDLSAYEMIACSVGLIIFTGLTAYDAQKMKKLYFEHEGDEAMLERLSMYSAMELFLDFINIFLYILRILGNKD